jgi:RNA recognition motif-containing protein
MSAPELVRAISAKVDIPSREIKGVCIFDSFAFVEVPRDSAEKVIEIMHKGMISGRKVAVAPARPRGAGGAPGPRRAAGR